MILGPDGKPVESNHEICPICKSGANNRVPSGGFGEVYWICKCGYDFKKELKCQPIVTQ
jgi:hypothetical protein